MRAAELIPDGCSVIVNVGTTTEEVARALVARRDLVVITNNLNVVGILSGTPGKELILAGGIVRQSDGAIVGDEAVGFIRRFRADFAVIGASALDEDGAILDYDMREVAVARAIVENARRTILVCDRLKFERSAPVRICDVSDIHAFVTDAPPPRAFAEACARAGVEVAIAGADRGGRGDLSMAGGDSFDLAVIGGGINGCGIARDAAGRGLKVVLVEQGDLAQATSSASTKLFHGGLRYLEYYEFRLVREALIEREVLLRAMPHIARPLRFVLPHHAGLQAGLDAAARAADLRPPRRAEDPARRRGRSTCGATRRGRR